jgi:two-component system NtrC family sensor kinase
MSEKLAAIGELTAGVAHEINNPIAVIQGNLDLLREELGPAAAPVANEIRLIHEQVHRIRLIVTKLLQFARPGEFAGYVEDGRRERRGRRLPGAGAPASEESAPSVKVVQRLRATAGAASTATSCSRC